ncbi:MAG: hypothetical protein VKS61_07490 [Candidatus Sericytochromatia bacterium]|nr:hypothetical protein [Candidatus Sericytochromatia bacterium]
MADATLTAFDLATGQALTLRAWSETGSGATGTQRTDAKGAFDLDLPKLADDQVVKLVAVSGSQTFTALFDARGRAVGAVGAQGASYRLAQGQAVSITIRLKLTPATTAAAKAFEGALKLTFQLPKEAREAERNAALAAAEQAAKEVESALTTKPELAEDLVVSVGTNGEVRDVDAFRSAVSKLGVFDKVFSAVQGRLQAVTAQKLTADGKLDAITAEDFPLDKVAISKTGGLTFTGGGTPSTLGGDLSASETVQLNGADLDISTAVNSSLAYSLAVQADGTATHIYWIDSKRRSGAKAPAASRARGRRQVAAVLAISGLRDGVLAGPCGGPADG